MANTSNNRANVTQFVDLPNAEAKLLKDFQGVLAVFYHPSRFHWSTTPGEVSNEMFSGMDWFPTLLAAAGGAEVLWAHPEYRTRSIPPAVGGRQGYRTHYFWTVQVTVSCIDLFVSTT